MTEAFCPILKVSIARWHKYVPDQVRGLLSVGFQLYIMMFSHYLMPLYILSASKDTQATLLSSLIAVSSDKWLYFIGKVEMKETTLFLKDWNCLI